MLPAFILFCIISFVILFSFILDQLFLQYRRSDKQLRRFFKKYLVDAEIGYYSAYGRRLRYLSIGNPAKPVLFFLHGAPSSLSFFRDYFVDPLLLKYFRIIAADRPGYGYSGFGKPLVSIKHQSEMLKSLIDSLAIKKQPLIIFGESYGTSIACRMAMDFPGIIDGLILIGPSMAPGEETVYKIAPLLEKPFINWMLPRSIIAANREKIFHKEELRKMLPLWNNITVPVMYMQGENDALINTSNAAFAREHLVKAPYLDITIFKDEPHVILHSKRSVIRSKIFEMLEMVREGTEERRK